MIQHKLNAGEAKITAQVVVRDKHGNVKYAGPLEMRVTHAEPDQKELFAPEKA